MAKKISELDEADELFDGCCFPIVQNEETKRVTFQTLKNEMLKESQKYLMSETNTGKTWINGKPIYRKVIHTGRISSQPKLVNHNIQNLDFVIDLKGIAKQLGAFYTLPRVNPVNRETQIELVATVAYIQLDVGTIAEFEDSYVFIEYTKLTD